MTPKTTRAPHAERSAFDPLIALCEAAVESESLHFVAHYRRGVMSFSVSVLDEMGSFGPDAGLLDIPLPQVVVERVGRQLNFLHTRINLALRSVESGYLIRMVLAFQRGGVFYYQIRPGEYLVCGRIDTDPRHMDAADVRAATLVEQIRTTLGLGTQNPGGFATVARVDRAGDLEGEHQPWSEGTIAAAPEAVALCQDAVHVDDLHYVACFQDDALLFSVDLLDHPALDVFFQVGAPEDRRSRYPEVGALLHRLAQQINSSLLAPLGAPLVQLVADVEQGAVNYVHLRSGDFLLGVTLDQSRVAMADAMMRDLAESLSSLDVPRGNDSRD